MDKNIPAKIEVKHYAGASMDIWCVCPNCGKRISWIWQGLKAVSINDHCSECGQALFPVYDESQDR